MKIAAFFAALLLALAGSATEFSAADRALAVELLKVNGTALSLESTIQATLKQMQGDAADPTRPVIEKFLQKCFAFDALKDDLARIYLENYTPAELRELIAFYRTALGRKKAEADAKIGAALSGITAKRFTDMLPELQKELVKATKHGN